MSNYKLKQTFGNIFHFVIYVLDTKPKPKTRRNVKQKVFLKKFADGAGNQFLVTFFLIIQSWKYIYLKVYLHI